MRPALFALLPISVLCLAAMAFGGRSLHLHGQVLQTHALPSVQAFPAHSTHFLVQFDQQSSASGKSEIEGLVGRKIDYVNNQAWVVYADRDQMQKVSKVHGVVWIGQLESQHKTPYDAEALVEKSRFNESCIALVVSVSEDPESILWESFAPVDLGFSVDVVHKNRVLLWISYPETSEDDLDLSWLFKLDFVSFVEPKPKIQRLNKWTRGVIQAGVLLPDYASMLGLPGWNHGIDGSGEIIGVGDTGVDATNCFFAPVPSSAYFSYSSGGASSTKLDSSSRKIVQYVTYADRTDGVGHGTHVSGTLVGSWLESDSTQSQYDGMASGAKLAVFDMGSGSDDSSSLEMPNSMEDFFDWAYEIGGRIHSNSWGASESRYSSTDADVDEYLFNNPEFIAVFAAGNDGQSGSSTISSPAYSKNAIAVGASCNSPYMAQEVYCDGLEEDTSGFCSLITQNTDRFGIDDLAYFSSMGPTADGRIKPDVVAPGFVQYSAWPASSSTAAYPTCGGSVSDSLNPLMGTSMSAPVVAGLLALTRQAFREGFYPSGSRNASAGFTPTGALLKAVLINGAVRLDDGTMPIVSSDGVITEFVSNGDAPDSKQGFGRPQLNKMMRFLNFSEYNVLIAGVSDGTYTQLTLDATEAYVTQRVCVVADNSVPGLRATLVWMDPPGSVLSSVSLVNDLDLIVTRINSTDYPTVLETYYPNGGSSADRVNNVEQVQIDTATRFQVFDVKVLANSIQSGPQSFALVISGRAVWALANGTCDFSMTWEDGGSWGVIDVGTGNPNDSSASSIGWIVAIVVVGVALILGLCCLGRKCCSKLNQKAAPKPKEYPGRIPAGAGRPRPRPDTWTLAYYENGRPFYINEATGQVSAGVPAA